MIKLISAIVIYIVIVAILGFVIFGCNWLLTLAFPGIYFMDYWQAMIVAIVILILKMVF